MPERKKYRTICADPPWEIGDFPANLHAQGAGTTPCPYPTMTLDEIKALPVKSLADNRDADAHLYLWTTAGFLRDSYDVAEAWGFKPMYPLVWCKAPKGRGLGGQFQSNIEFALFCRRQGYLSIDAREPRPDVAAITARVGEITRAAGLSNGDLNALVGSSDIASWWTSALPHRCAVPKPEHWDTLVTAVPDLAELSESVASHNAAKGTNRKPAERGGWCETRWWVWPRGKHSEKPEAFLDVVESVSPGPYLEMFARRNRLGWDTWGNQSFEHVEMAA